jgi:ferredoxin, 2Fe-2S
MARLIVVDRDGDMQAVSSEGGLSIMELIRRAGIGEMFAICGGCMSCATCHIYVDPAFRQRLPAMTDEEDELLSLSHHRMENSRLACQIPFRAELDGLRVQIVMER